MEKAIAKTKFIRMQPRKARLVADLVRGLSIESALAQLSFNAMKPAHYIKKTLLSAIANAELVHDMRRDRMFVSEIRIDGGPHMKRSKSKSKGGRVPILKRTSHILVAVSQKEES